MKSIQINNQTIQIPDDRYDELVKEFCGSKRWKPLSYITINSEKEMHTVTTVDFYPTVSEANERLAYINALAEINEYIAENEGKYMKEDNTSYEIYWNETKRKFVSLSFYSSDKMVGTLTISSEELALDLIANQSHNLKVVAGIR